MQLHSISRPIKSELKANSPKKLIQYKSTSSFFSNKSSCSSTSGGKKQIVLTRELLSKEKEKENYRMKYETAQSKLNFLYKKYTYIYKLFDSTLDKIYNEELKGDLKEIYINLDEFKSCEFDKLNAE